MSERGEVEVLVPVTRPASPQEQKELVRVAFSEAHKLVAPQGGRILGLVSVARGESVLGEQALKVRFAAEAPEGNWERKLVVAVGSDIKG